MMTGFSHACILRRTHGRQSPPSPVVVGRLGERPIHAQDGAVEPTVREERRKDRSRTLFILFALQQPRPESVLPGPRIRCVHPRYSGPNAHLSERLLGGCCEDPGDPACRPTGMTWRPFGRSLLLFPVVPVHWGVSMRRSPTPPASIRPVRTFLSRLNLPPLNRRKAQVSRKLQ